MPEKGDKQWPFNQPFFMIISMQVGGEWVDNSGPNNVSHYPASIVIDSVRVYKKSVDNRKVKDVSYSTIKALYMAMLSFTKNILFYAKIYQLLASMIEIQLW